MSDVKYDKTLLQALTKLTTTYAPLKGEDYYEAVCKYVVNNFEFEYAFVGKVNENITGVDVKAGWAKNKPITLFSYPLKDTPCEKVVSYDFEVYPKEVVKRLRIGHTPADIDTLGRWSSPSSAPWRFESAALPWRFPV